MKSHHLRVSTHRLHGCYSLWAQLSKWKERSGEPQHCNAGCVFLLEVGYIVENSLRFIKSISVFRVQKQDHFLLPLTFKGLDSHNIVLSRNLSPQTIPSKEALRTRAALDLGWGHRAVDAACRAASLRSFGLSVIIDLFWPEEDI